VRQWGNFENQSIIDEDMEKVKWHVFMAQGVEETKAFIKESIFSFFLISAQNAAANSQTQQLYPIC